MVLVGTEGRPEGEVVAEQFRSGAPSPPEAPDLSKAKFWGAPVRCLLASHKYF
jgi:hypothetical protein